MRAQLRRGELSEGCRQCGKVNQNVQIGRRIAERYGDDVLRAVTGRAPAGAAGPKVAT